MTEIDRILDQLQRAHDGDPWYGSSTHAVLEGLDAAGAARRVIPDAHTIWEIVLHIAAWQREVARRLRDGVPRMPEEGDWPAVPDSPSDAEWSGARARLDAAHAELRGALAALDPESLWQPLAGERDAPLGSGVTRYVTLHGVVQHNIAHTAQISLLRKGLT